MGMRLHKTIIRRLEVWTFSWRFEYIGCAKIFNRCLYQ